MKMKGVGIMMMEMKANNDAPQPYPSFEYIVGPASGIMAAKSDLKII